MITLHHNKSGTFEELSIDDFLARYHALLEKWEFGWSVVYKGEYHPILRHGMDSIPNSDAFKEMIRKGLW